MTDLVEGARAFVRLKGYASENDVCLHLLAHCFMAGMLGEIIDKVECDDIHSVKFMEAPLSGPPTHEARLFFYNPRTNPMPLRT